LNEAIGETVSFFTQRSQPSSRDSSSARTSGVRLP
jgi:hypothetical protein